MSNLLFIRSYLLIVLLILTVGWGLDRIMAHYAVQENISSSKLRLLGSFLYIEKLLEKNHQNIIGGWQHVAMNVQKNLGYPVALYQLSDFSDAAQMTRFLEAGKVFVMSDENKDNIYYRQLSKSDYIIALGPMSEKTEMVFFEIILISIYYLLVAGALLLWLWPLSRDLHELRRAAIDFGEENYATRVRLGKTSSIGSVAKAFNAMAQRIQELISAHKDLTYAVSHELKTPLARFKFSLQIIGDLDAAEQRKKYLKAMSQDVNELDELIDEMIRYAQFSTDNLNLNRNEINSQHWLESIVSQYEENRFKIPLILASQFNGNQKIIMIDKLLMSRAINNIIRNGLRYAKTQLIISLEIVNGQVDLLIEDDGVGIPEQFYEQVFQPFSRLDTSRDRQSGGYGLGLAIAQKILLQHGGEIYVEKSRLGGACFHLRWSCLD